MTDASTTARPLRRAINRRRRALNVAELRAAATAAAALFWRQPETFRCRRIAAYFANRGELECGPIIEGAWMRGREIYLPVLHRGELCFAPYRPGENLVLNRYGIAEPVTADGLVLRPSDLDLVITPLVACDSKGTRLGMGGGYYDRSFRFLRHRCYWRKPRMIGLGYEFQRVPYLQRRSWDIPVDAMLTENAFYRFQH